jgi:antitoxin component YwqK of YwqJK toxin-antitoxin module
MIEYIYSNKNDTLTYLCRVYYESGKIKHKAKVAGGKFVGDKITYYENGKIERIERLFYPTSMDDSLYDCHITNYRQNGTKESDYTYKNDKLNGLATDYDSTGKVARTTEYIDGKVNGLSILYYPNGRIKTIAHCKNDSAVGYEYEFDEKGDTLRANIHYGYSDNGVFYKRWLTDGRIVTGTYGDSDRSFVIWKWYDNNRNLVKTKIDRGSPIDSLATRFIPE